MKSRMKIDPKLFSTFPTENWTWKPFNELKRYLTVSPGWRFERTRTKSAFNSFFYFPNVGTTWQAAVNPWQTHLANTFCNVRAAVDLVRLYRFNRVRCCSLWTSVYFFSLKIIFFVVLSFHFLQNPNIFPSTLASFTFYAVTSNKII